VEHLCVMFGDPSYISFKISCRKTIRQMAVKTLRYPVTAIGVGKYTKLMYKAR